jgi:hypothetical protein
MLRPSSKIYVDKSKNPKAGRGIFAAEDIEEAETIELCPVIQLSKEDSLKVKETLLNNYCFMWGGGFEKEKVAVCLGHGSLYNHSYNPNATYIKNLEDGVIEFVAIKPIKKGEEITANYNYGDPNSKKKLWIEDIEPYMD